MTMQRPNAQLDRIATDPEVCLGKVRVRGTRITAEFVLKLMANGYTDDDIVREYPELTVVDVRQCVAYRAEQSD